MPTDPDFDDLLAVAQADRDADVENLGLLGDTEVAYLAGVGHLDDPDTDGLECDADHHGDHPGHEGDE